jgi:hypothetical protein
MTSDDIKEKVKEKISNIDKRNIGMAAAGTVGAGGLATEMTANKLRKIATSEGSPITMRHAAKLSDMGSAASVLGGATLAGLAVHKLLKKKSNNRRDVVGDVGAASSDAINS